MAFGLLPIRAQPGGRKNELRPAVAGTLKVVVSQVKSRIGSFTISNLSVPFGTVI